MLSKLPILIVCTGNICRSVFAQAYLQERLSKVAREVFQVDSRGTGINRDLSSPDEISILAARHGLSLNTNRPRALEHHDIQRAKLIITATLGHRHSVLRLRPSALKRTFTILELAYIIDEYISAPSLTTPADRLDNLLNDAQAHRSRVAANLLTTDIVDPYRLGFETYLRMERQLVPALNSIAGHFDA